MGILQALTGVAPGEQPDVDGEAAIAHQAMLTFLGAALGLMGVLKLGTAGGPEISASTSLFDVLGYNLLVLSLILVLRLLLVMFRPER